MIPRRATRPVQAGNVLIRFHGKGPFGHSQTQEIKTPTGILNASTPETTAWDLVRYFKAAGGLENVATVLSELAERLDGSKLRHTLKQHGEIIVAQRLGYLLDKLGRRKLSDGLVDLVKKSTLRPLDPTAPLAGASESRKWNLLINVQVEPEA